LRPRARRLFSVGATRLHQAQIVWLLDMTHRAPQHDILTPEQVSFAAAAALSRRCGGAKAKSPTDF
jgi:hypothetical protein